MSEVIKALRLTQLENDLLDVSRQIKRLEGVINSPNVKQRHTQYRKKLLLSLAKSRRSLVDQITEASLLT